MKWEGKRKREKKKKREGKGEDGQEGGDLAHISSMPRSTLSDSRVASSCPFSPVAIVSNTCTREKEATVSCNIWWRWQRGVERWRKGWWW